MSNIVYETEARIVIGSRFFGIQMDEKSVPDLPAHEDINLQVTQDSQKHFLPGTCLLFKPKNMELP